MCPEILSFYFVDGCVHASISNIVDITVLQRLTALMPFGREKNASDIGSRVKVQGHGGIEYAGSCSLRTEA